MSVGCMQRDEADYTIRGGFPFFFSLLPFPHALPHIHSVYDSRVAPGVYTRIRMVRPGTVHYATPRHGTVRYALSNVQQLRTALAPLGGFPYSSSSFFLILIFWVSLFFS